MGKFCFAFSPRRFSTVAKLDWQRAFGCTAAFSKRSFVLVTNVAGFVEINNLLSNVSRVVGDAF